MTWHGQLYAELFAKHDNLTVAIAMVTAKVARSTGKLWDVMAESAIADIAKHLLKKPDWTVMKLRGSLHGCRYLLDQWEYLAETVNSHRFTYAFDSEDHILTLSLAGLPFNQRMREHPYNPPSGVVDREKRQKHVLNYINGKIAELRETISDHEVEDRGTRDLIDKCPTMSPDKTLAKLTREIKKVESHLLKMWKEALFHYGDKALHEDEFAEADAIERIEAGEDRDAKRRREDLASRDPQPKTTFKPFRPVVSEPISAPVDPPVSDEGESPRQC